MIGPSIGRKREGDGEGFGGDNYLAGEADVAASQPPAARQPPLLPLP